MNGLFQGFIFTCIRSILYTLFSLFEASLVAVCIGRIFWCLVFRVQWLRLAGHGRNRFPVLFGSPEEAP